MLQVSLLYNGKIDQFDLWVLAKGSLFLKIFSQIQTIPNTLCLEALKYIDEWKDYMLTSEIHDFAKRICLVTAKENGKLALQ